MHIIIEIKLFFMNFITFITTKNINQTTTKTINLIVQCVIEPNIPLNPKSPTAVSATVSAIEPTIPIAI